MYRIVILPTALRSLGSLDKPVSRRIMTRISWLSEHLDDVTPVSLKGSFSGACRLRVGDWRVIYSFDIETRIIFIHLVGHRSQIYRL